MHHGIRLAAEDGAWMEGSVGGMKMMVESLELESQTGEELVVNSRSITTRSSRPSCINRLFLGGGSANGTRQAEQDGEPINSIASLGSLRLYR